MSSLIALLGLDLGILVFPEGLTMQKAFSEMFFRDGAAWGPGCFYRYMPFDLRGQHHFLHA